MRAIRKFCQIAIPVLTAGCSDVDGPSANPVALVSASHNPGKVVACGTSIVADLTLGNDLNCPGDALIVSADGVRLDLNGHTIMGSGVGVGITVRMRSDVSIFGGTIRNFVTGSFVSQSTNVQLTKNWFTQNREAVFFIGSKAGTIQWNVAWQNTERGIMLRPTGGGITSTQNVVVQNITRREPERHPGLRAA